MDNIFDSKNVGSELLERVRALSQPTTTRVTPGIMRAQSDEQTKALGKELDLANYVKNNPNSSFEDFMSAARRINDKYYPETTSFADKIKMRKEEMDYAAYNAAQVASDYVKKNPGATLWDMLDVYGGAFQSAYSPEAKEKLNAKYGDNTEPGVTVLASATSGDGYSKSYRGPIKDRETALEIMRQELLDNQGESLYPGPYAYIDEGGDIGFITEDEVSQARSDALRELNNAQSADDANRAQDEYAIVSGILKKLFGDNYSPIEDTEVEISSPEEQQETNKRATDQETPDEDTDSTREASAQESEEIEYTYKDGDTFGQVLLDLGLSDPSGRDLWGDGGDVEYYTNQLYDQGIWGNIPVGKTIRLKRRPRPNVPSAPDTGAI